MNASYVCEVEAGCAPSFVISIRAYTLREAPDLWQGVRYVERFVTSAKTLLTTEGQEAGHLEKAASIGRREDGGGHRHLDDRGEERPRRRRSG